jgi:hypothetical protein
VGAGNLSDVRPVLALRRDRPNIVVARRLSQGAREVLTKSNIGWVDESGAAEIAAGAVVVSRTGRPSQPAEKSKRWTGSAIAVAEALLCGTKATVSAMHAAIGLSTGSCSHALRFLTDLRLLESLARRGRNSARVLSEPDRLLDEYASAVADAPQKLALQVGVTWRDIVAGLVETGNEWNRRKVVWASTGAVAASAVAPYLTSVTSAEVYVEAQTVVGLESIARATGLDPIDGGRLTLRPFPTIATRRLAKEVRGLRVAPWPRVFADLRTSGVRGEEAAEHLRETVRAG